MKISIITINYKNLEGLKKTVQSIVEQTYTDVEYIVIDGNSQDGTSEFLQNNDSHISYWISEPDEGIYNAMNKGIKRATGDYLLFINSGDYLIKPTILKESIDLIDTKCSFVSGNIKMDSDKAYVKKSPDKISLSFFLRTSLPHPATFIKKDMFTKYGLYNEQNKVVSDYEFFLKTILFNRESYNHIDIVISSFDMTGISTQNNLAIIERENVMNQYFWFFKNKSLDEYVFNQLKNPSKRMIGISNIEESVFLRKLATGCLNFLNMFK